MRRLKNIFLLLTAFLLIFSIFYLYLEWDRNTQKIEEENLLIAEIAAIGLDGEMIRSLRGIIEDQNTVAYQSIKKRLNNFKVISSKVSFVYLYNKKEDSLYFLVDSEPIGSEDYSPPGQKYIEADEQYFKPFETKDSLITDPVIDRWGTWVSVLVPIEDLKTGKIIAVLGVDYPAGCWNRLILLKTVKSSIFLVFLFVLLWAFYFIFKIGIKTKESENRFKELSKQSKTFIWEVDSNANYLYVSDNVKDILGYSKKELLQKTVIDLHPQEGKEQFKKEVLTVLNNKEKIRGLENPIVSKNGKIVWVLSAGFPVLDKKGNLLKFRGSDTDITQIKEIEQEIKSNKEKYETLVTNVPGTIYRCLFDKNWTMVYIGREIERLSGYSWFDFIDNKVRSYESIIHLEDKDYVETTIKKAINNKEPWEIEYRIINKNKEIKWVLEKGRANIQENKDVYLDGIIFDITDRRKIEIELSLKKEDLEKFKLAVDGAFDHIVITDEDGICLYANDMVEKITGFSKKEIIGKKVGTKENWGGLMDQKTYEILWKTIKESKKPFLGELKNKRKNGQEYYAQASVASILSENKEVKFFVGIERDVTKEREIDKTKTEFVSLASHQLRTPLSTINWYSEMLLSGDAGKINKEQKKYLEEIYQGNQRMVSLVNALLNVSRLELGTFSIEPEIIDIIELSKNIIKDVKIRIEQKEQKLIEKYQEKLPKIKADRKLLHIVIENLLSNATKYTPEKGEIIIDISLIKKGQKIDNKKITKDSFLIIVSDNGYGISDNQHDKVFHKLFRADNILDKDTEGTGLGLYIVKSILEQSGGQTWFNSKENKGTTFYVVIPDFGMKKRKGVKTLN